MSGGRRHLKDWLLWGIAVAFLLILKDWEQKGPSFQDQIIYFK